MERKLAGGDYVPDGVGGFVGLSGGEEVLARVLFRRGGLPFLPRLGSRLHELGQTKPSARQALAVQYVAEALEEEQEIIVRSVELTQTGTQGRLNASLEWQGETLTVELDLPRVWS